MKSMLKMKVDRIAKITSSLDLEIFKPPQKLLYSFALSDIDAVQPNKMNNCKLHVHFKNVK